MKNLMIPVGISDFEEIREKGYYYIDKSGLITDILKNEATKVTLITRPRRFRKTMAMSMLASFFDIEKDSMIMFDGLKVAKNNKMLCEKWMNQCPVIFLSFKDVDGRTFENAFELLKFTIAQFCDAHAWLENSEKVTDTQKMIFKRLKNGTASMIDVQTSLCILIKMMHAHYDRKVILLLDEYNIPVTLLCDTNHVLTSEYSEVIVVGAGANAVDYKLISICHKGDIVVSQDYGVAAMAFGKGVFAIHQSGKWYTNDNIEQMLMERHLNKKARRSSHKNHIKGPKKRTEEDDERFAQSFEKMIRMAVESEM